MKDFNINAINSIMSHFEQKKPKEDIEYDYDIMKHTKGRWYLQEFTDVYTNIVRCDAGKGFETIMIAYTPQLGENARDNAKLISKAPEMLEALKELANMSPDGNPITLIKKAQSLLKELE